MYAKLGEIHDIGYRATELIEFNGFAGGIDRAKEVRRLLRDAGIRGVGNFHLTYATPQNLRNAAATFAQEDRAAGMLGLGMVAAEHDPEWQTEARYRELARDFNTWGRIAKKAGLRFYLHDEAWVFDRDPVTGKVLFDVWIEETDPDLVWFCLDVMWPAYRGLDPVDYLRRLERHDRITHFHIKDWNGQQAAPGAPRARRRPTWGRASSTGSASSAPSATPSATGTSSSARPAPTRRSPPATRTSSSPACAASGPTRVPRAGPAAARRRRPAPRARPPR